jgi:hypothetical protein
LEITNRLLALTLAFSAITPAVSFAQQSEFDQSYAKGFLSVNFGYHVPAESGYENGGPFTQFFEVGEMKSVYKAKAGADLDFGGGFMFTRNLGVGVTIAGHGVSYDVTSSVDAPSPIDFNSNATNSTETTGLIRSEGAVHLSLVGATHPNQKTTIRFSGGPTFFRFVQQDFVDQIDFTHTSLRPHRIQMFDSTDTYELDPAWGFHVATDVDYFFNRVFGIGGVLRYTRAEVQGQDYVSGDEKSYKVGGVQAAGGIRLRFGK